MNDLNIPLFMRDQDMASLQTPEMECAPPFLFKQIIQIYFGKIFLEYFSQKHFRIESFPSEWRIRWLVMMPRSERGLHHLIF